MEYSNTVSQFRLLFSSSLIQRTRFEPSLYKYSISFVLTGKHPLQLGRATVQAVIFLLPKQQRRFESRLHKYVSSCVRTVMYQMQLGRATTQAVSFLLHNKTDRVRAQFT
jgi:hypothetical protein